MALISDAAHAMTMYRGEAAELSLASSLLRLYPLAKGLRKGLWMTFEAEMRKRTSTALLLSRQARFGCSQLGKSQCGLGYTQRKGLLPQTETTTGCAITDMLGTCIPVL